MVSFSSPYFCGSGGCNLLILDKNFNLITNFTITRAPVLVDSKTTNGWNDILLWSYGEVEVTKLESKEIEQMVSLFETIDSIKTHTL